MYERFAFNFDIQKIDKIALITSTNKAANMHNREIRKRLFVNANEGIQVGDLLMLTNTDYNKGNTIYNGQLGKVLMLDSKIEEVVGVKFKYAKIEFNSNTSLVKTVYKPIILNVLDRDDVGLSLAERKALTHHAFVNNKDFRDSGMKSDDVFLSALQMRYAYALTCHKAQGGEWENIVVDPYVAYSDARMQYTAITRARKHVASYHC
jgi:exodeoxyribonuclease-5